MGENVIQRIKRLQRLQLEEVRKRQHNDFSKEYNKATVVAEEGKELNVLGLKQHSYESLLNSIDEGRYAKIIEHPGTKEVDICKNVDFDENDKDFTKKLGETNLTEEVFFKHCTNPYIA